MTKENLCWKGRSNFKEKLKGTVVAFLVVLKYTASGVSVQLLERRIPDLELNTIRNGESLHSVFSCTFIET